MKALRDNVGHNQYAREANEDTCDLIVYFFVFDPASVVAISSVIANVSHENRDVIWLRIGFKRYMCIK